MDTLKLVALDSDDLAVISAHLQDAVLKVGDMAWLPREQPLRDGREPFRLGRRPPGPEPPPQHGPAFRPRDEGPDDQASDRRAGRGAQPPCGDFRGDRSAVRLRHAGFLRRRRRSGSRSSASRRDERPRSRLGDASAPRPRADLRTAGSLGLDTRADTDRSTAATAAPASARPSRPRPEASRHADEDANPCRCGSTPAPRISRRLRALLAMKREISEDVDLAAKAIIEDVVARGDAALADYTQPLRPARPDGRRTSRLRREVEEAMSRCDRDASQRCASRMTASTPITSARSPPTTATRCARRRARPSLDGGGSGRALRARRHGELSRPPC